MKIANTHLHSFGVSTEFERIALGFYELSLKLSLGFKNISLAQIL